MSTFTDDLLEEIKHLIEEGVVGVDNNWASYTKVIESNFPFSGSKIDWDRVPGSIQREQDPQGDIVQQGLTAC